MKIKVKVDGQIYDVQVGDITQYPIEVIVNSRVYSVWPEEVKTPDNLNREIELNSEISTKGQNPSPLHNETQLKGKFSSVIRAPIPGLVTSVSIRPGSEVAIGQELCKLEAMKMNNSIRSNRPGRVNFIHINVGQQVKHGDVLVEFYDD